MPYGLMEDVGPDRRGALCVHSTCVYIRRQGLASSILSQVCLCRWGAERCVSLWWEAVRAGLGRGVPDMWSSE